ncbi:MAG: cytochrome c3 family protein [Kiritimatiellia bacterium]
MNRNIAISLLITAVTAAFGVVPSHWDGGRNTPLHKLALRDSFDDEILPNSPTALPLSTRNTCGQCHDYETISSGWHFNASSTNVCPGRISQPWFLIDKTTGSQIPMSLRSWDGLYEPDDLNMTDWEWVHAFGRHLPGGDIAEPEDIYAEGGPNARWEVSGKLEINCFACHSHDKLYDHSEYVRLMARENFSWAASGALGIGDIGGMGSRVPRFWDPLHGLDRDDQVYKVPPHIDYDMSRFDSKNRAVLHVDEPRNENCLNCHSTTQAGMASKDIDGDVHLRAGMNCTDCHGNGLQHDIARGFEGDTTGVMDRVRETATCVGCHNGTDEYKAGRHGAPRPEHIGFPLIHFEKLSCTVCHSGVTEKGRLAQVRTSRANRMGVYGRARWVTPAPFILEPVFVQNDKGVIEPRRMSWPAFWCTTDENGEVSPLSPDEVNRRCADELNVRGQLGAVLDALATDPNIPGFPALAIDGVCFAADPDGMAMPVGKDESLQGLSFVYVVEGTNNPPVVPDFKPDADTTQMTDPQYEEFADKQDSFNNLLQTLDASELANGRYGAVVLDGHIYYRGGPDQTVISTNVAEQPVFGTAGFYADGSFESLINEYMVSNVAELADSDCSLTENMVAAVLRKLDGEDSRQPGYVAHGKLWMLNDSGELIAEEHKTAEPVSWALGHDVRPARMARGAKPIKCDDCHTAGSDFFFADVSSTGPLLTARNMVRKQAEYMKVSGSYNKLFGLTFTVRPLLKVFLWFVFGILCLVAVAFAAAGVPALLAVGGMQEGTPKEQLMTKIDRLSYAGITASSAYLAVSGLAGWCLHLMQGYVLVLHIVAGGLFALCLVVLIWTRGADRIARPVKSWLWLLMIVLGIVVIFTAVAPMMTIFGTEWQYLLLMTHRISTVAFLITGLITLVSGRN